MPAAARMTGVVVGVWVPVVVGRTGGWGTGRAVDSCCDGKDGGWGDPLLEKLRKTFFVGYSAGGGLG